MNNLSHRAFSRPSYVLFELQSYSNLCGRLAPQLSDDRLLDTVQSLTSLIKNETLDVLLGFNIVEHDECIARISPCLPHTCLVEVRA